MTTRHGARRLTTLAALALALPMAVPLATPAVAGAQDLAARVAAVGDGRVEVRFAARDGVCGDGRTFIRIGENQYHGTWNGDDLRTRTCEPGPVRVLARVADGRVEDVRTFVGPAPAAREAGVTDLGEVPAAEATRWLMGLARTGQGRAASRAIMPAVIADGAVVWRDLLAVARDTDGRPRDVRREAAHWLSRYASAALEGRPGDVIAADEGTESAEVEVKKSAVFALSQLRGDQGVPQLVQVARTSREPAVRRSALFWLGQSGDPRGLDVMEEVLAGGRR